MKLKDGKLVVSQEVWEALNKRLEAVKRGVIDKFDIVRTASNNSYYGEYEVLNSKVFDLKELVYALHDGYITEKPKYKKEDLLFRMYIKDNYDAELTVINQGECELYSVTMIEDKIIYTVMVTEEEVLNNLNDGTWILQ